MPTVEDEDFAVVVVAGAAVVVDEDSFFEELHPATARPATATTARVAIAKRFFKGFSRFSWQFCLREM